MVLRHVVVEVDLEVDHIALFLIRVIALAEDIEEKHLRYITYVKIITSSYTTVFLHFGGDFFARITGKCTFCSLNKLFAFYENFSQVDIYMSDQRIILRENLLK
jgi:hypothetical protein